MARTVKIKLSIGDRIYPMTVLPEQEEGLRKAVKSIEQLAKHYEQNYAVRDKQDVLAMCALQFASQKEQSSIDIEKDIATTKERLINLTHQIDEVLSQRS